MDHTMIEKDNLVERYLMGRLKPAEAEAFEDHYLDCPECLETLEATRRLRGGLARVAAEEATKAEVRRLGLLAALSRFSRSRVGAVAVMALFVAALLPTGLLVREVGELRGELERTRDSLTAARREAEARSRPAPDADLEAVRREAAEEQARLQRELAEERQRRERLDRELGQAWQPQTNTPLVSLTPERSRPGDRGPSTVVPLPASPDWIILSLELNRPEHLSYNVRLLRGDREIWRGRGIEPNLLDALVISLPSRMLDPGDYALVVEGIPARGGGVPVARFAFRAER